MQKGLVATVTKRYQFAIHHGRCNRRKTLTKEHYQSQVRAIGGTSDSEVQRSSRSSAQGRWLQDRRINEIVMGWRYDPYAPCAGIGQRNFRKDGHRGVNPDEVVAVGAAIQGAQILLVVCPISFWLTLLRFLSAWKRKVAFHQVDREEHNHSDNEERIFTTADDNQRAVTVKVFQGERPMANDNRCLHLSIWLRLNWNVMCRRRLRTDRHLNCRPNRKMQATIVICHWSFALENFNSNGSLIVVCRGEIFFLRCRKCCVLLDQLGENATLRFQAERKRSNRQPKRYWTNYPKGFAHLG